LYHRGLGAALKKEREKEKFSHLKYLPKGERGGSSGLAPGDGGGGEEKEKGSPFGQVQAPSVGGGGGEKGCAPVKKKKRGGEKRKSKSKGKKSIVLLWGGEKCLSAFPSVLPQKKKKKKKGGEGGKKKRKERASIGAPGQGGKKKKKDPWSGIGGTNCFYLYFSQKKRGGPFPDKQGREKRRGACVFHHRQ